MDQEARLLTDGQLESFVQKLAEFRRSLSQPEQEVLDVMLTAGEAEEPDVVGYLFVENAHVRQAGARAVDRLRRTVGPLHPSPQGLLHRLAHTRQPAPE